MTHPLSKALRELGEKLDGEGAVTLDEKADMDEAADALDARVTTEAEWQDISTAPKDETQILLASASEIYHGYWWSPLKSSTDGYWNLQHIGSNAEDAEIYDELTHWMPLPRKPGEPTND